MRQRQPLQGNNSQTGWQRLGENSQSCVGVAGGGGGSWQGWQGKWHCTFPCGRPWNEKRAERGRLRAKQHAIVWRRAKLEGNWQNSSAHTLRIRDFPPLSTHPALVSISLPLQTYFTFDSRAEQQTEVYLRYGQHPELYPNRRGEVVQGWVDGRKTGNQMGFRRGFFGDFIAPALI